MIFHWSLSDKSSQIPWNLLSILVDLNNVVVLMVSSRPLISKSSNPFTNPLVTVPRIPITIGVTVTFMFQSFQFPSKVEVIILLFTFFQFYFVVNRDSKVDNSASSFFLLLLIIIRSSRLVEIKGIRYNHYFISYEFFIPVLAAGILL